MKDFMYTDTMADIILAVYFSIVGFFVISPILQNVVVVGLFTNVIANIFPLIVVASTIGIIGMYILNIFDRILFEGRF